MADVCKSSHIIISYIFAFDDRKLIEAILRSLLIVHLAAIACIINFRYWIAKFIHSEKYTDIS